MNVISKTYKVVTPSDGMWLYNESSRSISDKLYVPDNVDLVGWIEIDEARKIELEAQWEKEAGLIGTETDTDNPTEN